MISTQVIQYLVYPLELANQRWASPTHDKATQFSQLCHQRVNILGGARLLSEVFGGYISH